MSVQPFYPSHAVSADDYDDASEQYGPSKSTESHALVYTLVAAFLGWIIRGLGAKIFNFKWSKAAKKVAEFVCAESLLAENRKLPELLPTLSHCIQPLVHFMRIICIPGKLYP